jgi:mRNA interferase MazF
VVTARSDIHWVDLGAAVDSGPAKRRPVLVVQDDRFNRSGIATTVVAVVSSNTALAELPGNVFLPSTASGLPKDSAVNVSQLLTVDKRRLGEVAGSVSRGLMDDVDRGLRLALGLPPRPS